MVEGWKPGSAFCSTPPGSRKNFWNSKTPFLKGSAPAGGMWGSPCRSFLQIREFLAVSIHEPVGQQRHVFALDSRRQGKETH